MASSYGRAQPGAQRHDEHTGGVTDWLRCDMAVHCIVTGSASAVLLPPELLDDHGQARQASHISRHSRSQWQQQLCGWDMASCCDGSYGNIIRAGGATTRAK
ncbi:hypothetical protein V8C44DRAFT_219220 [Trichoderma aethiopicum]